MKRIACVIWLTALFTVAARADKAADARKAIQALYDSESRAAMAKDLSNLYVHCAPQYVAITAKGRKRTLNELRGVAPQVYAVLRDIHDSVTIRRITLSGGTATVIIRQHSDAVIHNLRTKRLHKLITELLAEDVWKRTGSVWKKLRSKTLVIHETLDGQAVTQ